MADSKHLASGRSGMLSGTIECEHGFFFVYFLPVVDYWTDEELDWLEEQAKQAVKEDASWPQGREPEVIKLLLGCFKIKPKG